MKTSIHDGVTAPEIQSVFLAAINAAGLEFTGPIVADAGLQRFKVNGDKAANSWYVLHTDGLPAGRFGCWQRGIDEGWCYKSADTLTAEERAERDRRWKQQQQERDADRQRPQNQAGTKAAAILDTTQPAHDDHPYLVRKAVKAAPGVMCGAWLGKPNCLLIPLRTAGGQLATIQAISPDAPFSHSDKSKDFLKGGAKAGAYFVIGDLAESPVILIAEGYATAATLHEATGYAAVMACDTSGLTPVTQALKTLYPHPKVILICADNDRTTEGNPGVKAARAAAKKVGCRLAIPEFAEDEAGSDFNDLATLHGLDMVKTAIKSALNQKAKATGPAPAQDDPDGFTAGLEAAINAKFDKHHPDLMRKSGTDQLLKNHHNAMMVAENAYLGLIAYNEFRQRIEKRFDPPWGGGSGQWTDRDTGEIAFRLSKPFAAFNPNMMGFAVMTVAYRHPFNPAQDRLRALADQWDGKSRIDSWLVDYLGAGVNASNADYLREISACWIKGVAARVLKPGCKRDDVLVLCGKQGLGKSTAAQHLSDGIQPDSFTDNLGDLSSKDSRSGIRGIIIAELGELASLNKSDIESIKTFVATRSDHFREAYGKGERDYPRTVSFIGTTNNPTFLIDPTGNRRWWPVTIGGPINIPRFASVIPQLLGEAAARVLKGERWHVTDEAALAQADNVRAAHFDEDVWTTRVKNAVADLMNPGSTLDGAHPDYVTIPDILNVIGVRVEQQTKVAGNRVGSVLRMMKFTLHRNRKPNGDRFYAWYPPVCPTTPTDEGSCRTVVGQKEASQTAAKPTSPTSPTSFLLNNLNQPFESHEHDEDGNLGADEADEKSCFTSHIGKVVGQAGLVDQASQTAASGLSYNCPTTISSGELGDKNPPPVDAIDRALVAAATANPQKRKDLAAIAGHPKLPDLETRINRLITAGLIGRCNGGLVAGVKP